MDAEEILKKRAALNRINYQKRIAESIEEQQESSYPSNYQSFESSSGAGIVQDSQGNTRFLYAQSNGAVGLGDQVLARARRFDEMPAQLVQPAIAVKQTSTSPKGFMFVLDSNWLPDATDQGNIDFLTAIFKYFLGTRKIVHTIKYDPRIYTSEYPALSTWLVSQEGRDPPALVNLVMSSMSLVVKEIDLLSTPQSIESLLWIPLFSYGASFTSPELLNLKKIAQQKGLFIIGEHNGWTDLDNQILDGLNLSRIQAMGSFVGSYTFYRSKLLKDTSANLTVLGSATAKFSGMKDSESIMTFVDSSTGEQDTNMILVKSSDIT